mmetsp:Transcript_3453/g.8248  ORF Transcript_3453/g.8248 Transcript_3453/m.8248 type:complete len:88 (+) Transcript_3453:191-454(+)|eukprot:1448575-Rhodomonas_salina.1
MGCGSSTPATVPTPQPTTQYKNAEEVFRDRLGPEFVRRFSQSSIHIERRMSNPTILATSGPGTPTIGFRASNADDNQKIFDPEPKEI